MKSRVYPHTKGDPIHRARVMDRFSRRVLGHLPHQLTTKAEQAHGTDKIHPKLTGDGRKRWARRWARNKLRAARL